MTGAGGGARLGAGVRDARVRCGDPRRRHRGLDLRGRPARRRPAPRGDRARRVARRRARSWKDPTTGDPVHVGPHIVTDCYPNFFRLLGRLGTADRVVWEPESLLYTMFDGARAIELRRSSLPPPVQMLATLRADPELGLLDLASNAAPARVALGLDEQAVLRLDGLDGAAALDILGVRPAMQRRYWQFAAMSILNTPLGRVSAGSLLRAFHHAITRDAVRVGFPGVGLGDLFAPGARAAIEAAGHPVWTGTSAAEILGDETRATGVRLVDGRILRARHVVSTLPPGDLAALLPESWQARAGLDSLRWFSPVPYVSVYLWFDRRITARQFWARSYHPDDLNCDFYDYANIYPDWGAAVARRQQHHRRGARGPLERRGDRRADLPRIDGEPAGGAGGDAAPRDGAPHPAGGAGPAARLRGPQAGCAQSGGGAAAGGRLDAHRPAVVDGERGGVGLARGRAGGCRHGRPLALGSRCRRAAAWRGC
ncbi:FAD-dependent oxidoreductase [Nannocystis pusilla]|uniref:FAD-dependent oxidoreductase n=1 Tax=Nannocystis pusilla TaxID=889268 RepID=A0A9X3J4G6_9BACT|nr:FAD-dependent oxidoreductase [Nannocystis pusilla]MCY1013859.1 FAD-dependent oxidoreductase [Nannocystis pusilla]